MIDFDKKVSYICDIYNLIKIKVDLLLSTFRFRILLDFQERRRPPNCDSEMELAKLKT